MLGALLERTGVIEPALLRALVVDDAVEIRSVLKLALELDGRFEVVGEAGDGEAAVTAAAATQPDLVILDRHMPKMDGLQALPLIRDAAPGAVVVLFTALADSDTRQAALSAGAAAVREKITIDDALLDDLAGLLAQAVAPAQPDELSMSIGPLPIGAARVWIPNTMTIVQALLDHPERASVQVPAGDLETFVRFLHQWQSVAEGAETEFYWSGAAPASTVRSLVESWAKVDSMTDADLDALGIHWSPPEGQPFFEALTAAALTALAADPGSSQLSGDLRQQWG